MDEELRELERRARTEPGGREALLRARERAGLPTLAVIACIHSNLEALTAVLADIDRRGIPDIICLGDVTGYGPDPVACTDLVMERCRVTLKGNHDEALHAGAWNFGAHARAVVEWTQGLLRPGPSASAQAQGRWTFLRDLPLRHEEAGRLYVHGSPRHPTIEYVLEEDVRQEPIDGGKIQEIFAAFGALLLVGHSHKPGLITEDVVWQTPEQLEGRWTWPGAGKAILNVGSVGQPRDEDPRACWLSVRGDTFEWHRVEYDIAATQAKLRAAGLPSTMAERLVRGV